MLRCSSAASPLFGFPGSRGMLRLRTWGGGVSDPFLAEGNRLADEAAQFARRSHPLAAYASWASHRQSRAQGFLFPGSASPCPRGACFLFSPSFGLVGASES